MLVSIHILRLFYFMLKSCDMKSDDVLAELVCHIIPLSDLYNNARSYVLAKYCWILKDIVRGSSNLCNLLVQIWKHVTLDCEQCCFRFSFLACVMWKGKCSTSSYFDFVKHSVQAVLVMNGWRATDCKHTHTVKQWRITSSFLFIQGHSECVWGQGSVEQGERRKMQLGEIERVGHAFVDLFYSSSVLSFGLIWYRLARWTPGLEIHLQG